MSLFPGRINRATYWFWLGATIVVFVVINQLSSRPVGVSEVILAAVCVPRLHDVGRSGWWVLPPFLLEVGGTIAAFSVWPHETALGFVGLIVLGLILLIVWLGVIRGQAGPNRFGDPPAPGIRLNGKTRPA